jgi:hypothetical protein
MDMLFEKLDSNGDKQLDMHDWMTSVADDCKSKVVSTIIFSYKPVAADERDHSKA